MSMRPAALTLAMAALLAAGGCGMTETGEKWSTKSESVVTGPLGEGSLHVAETTTDAALRDMAVSMLNQASIAPGHANALLRANAIEGMRYAPDFLEPLVSQGLVDDNRGVRFVAAMTIGERRMTRLAHLLEPLLRDESASVRGAAMYGLKECGRAVDLTPLASMILSDDPEVRANTAVILGRLGNPSAVPMLRQAIGRGMQLVSAPRIKMVDLQLAEAMVMLGEEQEIEVIRAALFGPPEQGEITALACMIVGRLDDERAVPNLSRLALETGRFAQPAEVRMAATWALACIEPARAEMTVPEAYLDSTEYQLRSQAALTLGRIGNPAGMASLANLLNDPNPLVQVAAASAILEIQNPAGTGAGVVSSGGSAMP